MTFRSHDLTPDPSTKRPDGSGAMIIRMARMKKGDKVIITEGDFKGERGAITDKDLLGDGITVALEKNGREIKTEEGHVNLVDD